MTAFISITKITYISVVIMERSVSKIWNKVVFGCFVFFNVFLYYLNPCYVFSNTPKETKLGVGLPPSKQNWLLRNKEKKIIDITMVCGFPKLSLTQQNIIP